MNEELTPEEVLLSQPFKFRKRPSSLSPDLRPTRRVALLCLAIDKCFGSKASLEQLHVLDWACRSESSRTEFLRTLESGRGPEFPCVRLDPSLNRAIDWGVGWRVFSTSVSAANASGASLQEYRVWLTPKGKESVKVLRGLSCFTKERELLDALPGKITQNQVEPFLRWELKS